MPCTTYYTEEQVRFLQNRLKDPEMQELLDEINSRGNRRWFIRKDVFVTRGGWFRRSKKVYLYELLLDCEYEWQIINFPGLDENGSINFNVERHQMMTYLMGLLNGMDLVR